MEYFIIRNCRLHILIMQCTFMLNKYVDTALPRIVGQQGDMDVKDSNLRLCERSLCPWKRTIDYDSKRIPETLVKAECLSDTCQFPTSSSHNRLFTTCEEVKTDILIYKNNKYSFIKDWPIACACTKRNVSRGQNISKKQGRSIKTSQRTAGKRKKKRRVQMNKRLRNSKQKTGRRFDANRKGKGVNFLKGSALIPFWYIK
ncbi:uncharacterized protein LOC132733557 [Ruditapes philippinarum]|uniref:uncharacterized protein LOC132733557 n=1 Tax=Ruditapes philippinarum TaxID=129788 RepID=UPI00295BBDF7|nr:uncharacterized protein LOC132733557 [Ruditapes philippinarum]